MYPEYLEDKKSALEALHQAQTIAFAPVAFQVTRVLIQSGILNEIASQRKEGITIAALIEKTKISRYGVKVLVDAGLSIGLIYCEMKNEKYDEKTTCFFITKTGHYLLNDRMTIANFNFTQDVCYKGLFHLDKAIGQGKPSGLREFIDHGDWDTVYEALKDMPKEFRKSWFGFDHFYSDGSFNEALKVVYQNQPQKLLDIGGNTGKWALASVKHDPKVEVTIADLPGQLKEAMANAKEQGFEDRIHGYETNLLDESSALPTGFDAVWMSQFLDCFSEEEIVSILKRVKSAVTRDGYIYIMETFWDRQRFETAAYALNMTSIYFTVMANGNSRMYHSSDFLKLVDLAGLKLVEEHDAIGISHSILKCGLK